MKLTHEEYMAMPPAHRIAAYYAEIDELIENSPNKDALRETQKTLDQIRFRHQDKPKIAYNQMLDWLQRSMLNQSKLLDDIEVRLGRTP